MANIYLKYSSGPFFLFLYFSLLNPQVYPLNQAAFSHEIVSCPQFKKVFILFLKRMHTACAERFLVENFVRCYEIQSGLSGDFYSTESCIKIRNPLAERVSSNWSFNSYLSLSFSGAGLLLSIDFGCPFCLELF
jgi:hypothetical protein